MALTNTELLVRVRAGLGRGEGRTDQDINIIQSINMAMEDMAKAVSYPELQKNPVDISTVADTNYVDLSDIITAGSHQSYDEVDQIFSLTLIDGSGAYELVGLPPRVFEKSFPLHADTDREDRPTHYTIIDERIFLYPTCDDVYTLRALYSLWPTPIQHTDGVIIEGSDPGEASAPVVFKKSDGCLTIGSLYFAYMIISNTEKMKTYFPVFEKLKKDDAKKHGKRLDMYPTGRSSGYTNTQSTGPSAAAQNRETTYDGVFTSTPHWG